MIYGTNGKSAESIRSICGTKNRSVTSQFVDTVSYFRGNELAARKQIQNKIT